MRLFIAVNIPQEVKDGIEAVQQGLKRSGADVKWVEKENLHLTLKFLGEIGGEEGKPGLVLEELKGSLKEIKPFKITLEGVGAFPSTKSPRVVWVGISEGAGELKRIAALIDGALTLPDLEKDKKEFSPHLTIGRVRSKAMSERLAKRLVSGAGFEARSFVCGSVELMQSFLKSTGPEYKCVGSISIS